MLNEILKFKSNVTITDIHWKSIESTSSSVLFYKIPENSEGVRLFKERIAGARYAWLVVNKEVDDLPTNSSVISEDEWPALQKKCLDILYPLPDIKFMAVTGTNGKTTTTDLILQLGHLIGKKGLSLGTLGVREYQRTILDFGLTSPSFIDLRKFLCTHGKDKDFCVMEASSHALFQDRLHSLQFDSAGWTSFSQDHLDYHGSMDEYFNAKCLIFSKLKPEATLFVPHEQQELFQKLSTKSQQVKTSSVIEGPLPLFFQTQFNRNNLEVAKAMLEEVFKVKVVNEFEKIIPPDGRFYIKPYKTNFIVVDFAHTPDALENICHGIRETFPNHHLKVLFGCGGDRDRTKRPLMAKVVDKWADEIYVTSDNPRTENPQQIIDDIVLGISKNEFQTIVDRPSAVKKAFSELKEHEVLLLAGKGHEDYILINGVKHPYSDIKEVDNFLLRKMND